MRSLKARRLVQYPAVIGMLVSSVAVAAPFGAGHLIVSRSSYTGNASTVAVGQSLPGGGVAVADGSYPGVWANEGPDPSFGVTSPISLDEYAVSGAVATLVSSLGIPTAQIVTSFSSKSEMALGISTDQKSIAFMGYLAPTNTLDVSNSNTPNHVDPTNPVGLTFQRGVAQIDALGNITVTGVNVYSGNNGRAAIFDSTHNDFLLVGNAGNGTGTEPATLVGNTGVQILTPSAGPEPTVVGVQQGVSGSATGFQFGYSVTQYGAVADKSGKDDNFRGMVVFNNTLYVTKGSGGNGINTVFQVGAAGTLPTVASAATSPVTILPGFPTTLAKNAGAMNPFGIWFANANTLYVADEGDGKASSTSTNQNAGLQKWILQGDGLWHNVYTLQAGLNLGAPYSVPGLASTLSPAAGGLRALTGKLNADGTATLYATTSTVSTSVDQGADSNQLVTIVDNVSFQTSAAASAEQFAVLKTAGFGEVLRGVAFAPVNPSAAPIPKSAIALLSGGIFLLGLGLLNRKKFLRHDAI